MSYAAVDIMPGVPTHYQLSCYVGNGTVVPVPLSAGRSWVSFTAVFNQRPNGFRYAVVRTMVLSMEQGVLAHRQEGSWLCFDLYHESLSKLPSRIGIIRAPPPRWTGPSEDALIMRALHHG